MKKIYKEYSYGKQLEGYDYNGVVISINYYDVTRRGNWHKDYVVPELKEKGLASRFETLKEAKAYIDEKLFN